ncbi:MAG: zinc metalloprotease HtpX [Candidatus Binatia bacterium]
MQMGSGLKTTFLLAGLSAILLVLGQLFGGQAGMVLAFVLAAVMNFSSYWYSDRVVLRLYRAERVDAEHRLHRIVRSLALKTGLPMPGVYLIPDSSPNAFATGRNPQHASVAATRGIVELLDDQELEGVMAHELAHVANRDILIQSVAATVGAAIMLLANMARWAAFFGVGGRGDDEDSSPLVLLVTAMLAPVAALLVQAAISRSREFAADQGGAEIAGTSEGLARALGKLEVGTSRVPMQAANPATAHLFIVSPFSGKGMARLFSTHPPVEERVRRLLGRV